MEYNTLTKNIMNLDKKVRFAAVCDDSGEIKYGGQREGIQNLLSPEETKRSNIQALARWSLRNSLASKIGKGQYAMAVYEKIKRITMPLDKNHLLYITTEAVCDALSLVDKIKKLDYK